jgi:signal transduction histidine kinase
VKVFSKLFFSFLGAVFLASAISGALFYYILSEKPGELFSSFMIERAQALRAITIELLAAQQGNEEEKAKALAQKYGQLAAASVWFIKNNSILAASSPGDQDIRAENGRPVSGDPSPEPLSKSLLMGHKIFEASGALLFHSKHSWTIWLELYPGRVDGLTLVVRINRREKRHGAGLLFSIVGVVLAFALLLYPVSAILSRPLAELRNSVLALAGGDLSRRANLKSRDEIGDLARAFNVMAGRIAHLIESARELNAHVSHELRSPLARMRIALELHRNKNQLTDVRHLESLQAEIAHLDLLVGKILLLARLESGGQIVRADCNMGDLLQKKIASSNEALPVKERVEIRPSLVPLIIKTDAELLQSALGNLLDNALKFAPAGSEIEITLKQEGNSALFSISNEAAPLDAEQIAAIFKPFVRGANIEPEQDGSGLGLALTRRIIEALGGRIEASYAGDRFAQHVWLPLD